MVVNSKMSGDDFGDFEKSWGWIFTIPVTGNFGEMENIS